MGAELLRRAADRLDQPRLIGSNGWDPVLELVGELLRTYADQERHTDPEDSPVDAAIHDLAEEILR